MIWACGACCIIDDAVKTKERCTIAPNGTRRKRSGGAIEKEKEEEEVM